MLIIFIHHGRYNNFEAAAKKKLYPKKRTTDRNTETYFLIL